MTFLDGCRHLHRADHPDHGRRDRRGTELTAAGARLLAEAPRLLAASTAMVRAVTAAAAETPRFTFHAGHHGDPGGARPGLPPPGTGRPAAADGWQDQVEVPHDGRAGVGVRERRADGDR
ncbi:hypothetical protein ABZ797_22940 [Streptomyces antimycoticus]|uniref:hypothetical protein n=1 Tax=Streptomyces antimycoticus TaxID=68175 RepID=UPI0033E9B69B